MVVNMGLFVPGKPLVAGTLWVLDQVPGYVESDDVTAVLTQQGYWASYNTPYFPKIYNVSGARPLLAAVDTWCGNIDVSLLLVRRLAGVGGQVGRLLLVQQAASRPHLRAQPVRRASGWMHGMQATQRRHTFTHHARQWSGWWGLCVCVVCECVCGCGAV